MGLVLLAMKIFLYFFVNILKILSWTFHSKVKKCIENV